MPPPPPWPLTWARLMTAVLFWPLLFGGSGALGLIVAFLLSASPAALGVAAIALTAGAAGLFAATRRYRWRTPPLDTVRSAVTAVVLLGTAAHLPLGTTVFSLLELQDGRVIGSLVIAMLGQIIAFVAFRWSVTVPE